MRENFENDDYFYYGLDQAVSFITSYIAGGLYTYQGQQKVINQLKQDKIDQFNELYKIFYGEVE